MKDEPDRKERRKSSRDSPFPFAGEISEGGDDDVVDKRAVAKNDFIEDAAARLAKAKEEALAAFFGSSTATEKVAIDTKENRLERPPLSKRKRAGRRVDDGETSTPEAVTETVGVRSSEGSNEGDDVAVDYVVASLEVPEEFGELSDVMARFAASGQPTTAGADGEDVVEGNIVENGEGGIANGGKGERLSSDDQEVPGNSSVEDEHEAWSSGISPDDSSRKRRDASAETLSDRQLRRRNRLTVAQLKALVPDPGVVEQWDVTASDPLLLVHLKSIADVVSVPANWRQKRKYLQGKRGMEKLPFQMPQFIIDTGICAARDALADADGAKTAKQKGRERIRPKSNSGVDIDYGAMRDAFFKFQTKPRLTEHGDLYYELREREVQHDKFRPGVLSASLREALGMGSKNDAPPWLVAMQRYGPPPSYPGLEIPGLNCPIPAGASFGFHKGGWGKPPVDINGRPLYGDVFGEGAGFGSEESRFTLSTADKESLWGEPEPVDSADGEDEFVTERHRYNRETEDVEDQDEIAEKMTNASEDAAANPIESAAVTIRDPGVLSVPPGVETPTMGIELRKGLAPGQLYSVLEQKDTSVGKGVMGSSHVYQLDGGAETETGKETKSGASDKADKAILKKRKADPTDESQRTKKIKELGKAQDFKF